jgi:ssDNA thymidine ADP-ribosyltransferase, DarT
MSTIDDIVRKRKITEIIHFTTNRGLTGILAERAVLSRQRLPESSYLEHVYAPNAVIRRDPDQLDYVNLSISRINTQFFGVSTHWHANQDVWWCAVSFDPVILRHDGVLFATTNNMYTGCARAAGAAGLAALFADHVLRWSGNVVARAPGMPENWTTCQQAEVLYPRSLSCDYLLAIYVATGPHADIAEATRSILLGPDQVPILIRPDVFEP